MWLRYLGTYLCLSSITDTHNSCCCSNNFMCHMIENCHNIIHKYLLRHFIFKKFNKSLSQVERATQMKFNSVVFDCEGCYVKIIEQYRKQLQTVDKVILIKLIKHMLDNNIKSNHLLCTRSFPLSGSVWQSPLNKKY